MSQHWPTFNALLAVQRGAAVNSCQRCSRRRFGHLSETARPPSSTSCFMEGSACTPRSLAGSWLPSGGGRGRCILPRQRSDRSSRLDVTSALDLVLCREVKRLEQCVVPTLGQQGTFDPISMLGALSESAKKRTRLT